MAFVAALSYRKLNQPEQAERVLGQAAAAMVAGSWTERVWRFLQGKSSAADLMRKAKSNQEQTAAHA